MDLHDTLGQDLTGVAFLAKVLSEKLTARGAAEAAEAVQIGQRINQAIALTRSLARGLVPVDPGDEGLTSALHDLAHNVHTTFGVDCRFTCDRTIRIHDSTIALHLFQIAREAANNAITHGKARRLDLTLTDSDERITLIVRDDGVGLPAEAGRGEGIGLHVMNHRARMIGGVLSVQAVDGGGTAVTCMVRRGGN